LTAADSKTRFSNRVDNYVKWRPSYPAQVVTELQTVCDLEPNWRIADIGSGPGNLTRLFLDFGASVIGVEPNKEMREAGDVLLEGYPRFESVDGTAEKTGLADASVDLVTAGQAFHWFKVEEAKQEFQRILTGPKWVALIWNDRPIATTPFLAAYEELLRRRSTEYLSIRHQDSANDHVIGGFFGPGGFQQIVLPYEQIFDAEGPRGRLLSSSYAPAKGQPGHEEMLVELDQIFAEHQENGMVHFLYDSRIYVGRLTS